MTKWIPSILFFAAFLCFIVALFMGTKLGSERVGTAPTRRQFMTGWIPGEFTSRGKQLRRRVNRVALLGTILLASAILL